MQGSGTPYSEVTDTTQRCNTRKNVFIECAHVLLKSELKYTIKFKL